MGSVGIKPAFNIDFVWGDNSMQFITTYKQFILVSVLKRLN